MKNPSRIRSCFGLPYPHRGLKSGICWARISSILFGSHPATMNELEPVSDLECLDCED
jgi:hypothetical protein